MINLDERYHSYLDGRKKLRIDGIEEKVKSYGWHCDGNDIKGHYVTTENYKLYYNMEGIFTNMVAIRELSTVTWLSLVNVILYKCWEICGSYAPIKFGGSGVSDSHRVNLGSMGETQIIAPLSHFSSRGMT